MSAEDEKIMRLLSVFDNPRSSLFNRYFSDDLYGWVPQDDSEKEAFHALIDPVNRDHLKRFYQNFATINPMADAFRRILQKAIGERLPLAGEASNGEDPLKAREM